MSYCNFLRRRVVFLFSTLIAPIDVARSGLVGAKHPTCNCYASESLEMIEYRDYKLRMHH